MALEVLLFLQIVAFFALFGPLTQNPKTENVNRSRSKLQLSIVICSKYNLIFKILLELKGLPSVVYEEL
jgi:hypothetical protein